jgi:small subunit ribosomal protein S20
MTHSKQAAKRVRQNEKRRLRNKAKASAVKTQSKRILAADEAGQPVDPAALRNALAQIDKAAKARVLHKNTAARRKSRLMRAAAKAKKGA